MRLEPGDLRLQKHKYEKHQATGLLQGRKCHWMACSGPQTPETETKRGHSFFLNSEGVGARVWLTLLSRFRRRVYWCSLISEFRRFRQGELYLKSLRPVCTE